MSSEQTHWIFASAFFIDVSLGSKSAAGFDVPPWVNGYGQECGGPQASGFLGTVGPR